MAEDATQQTTAPAGDGTQDAQTGGSDKTFTQADLDRVVQDRLAREREKFAGFEDIKSKAEEFDKLKESQRSDLEKLQAERDELKTQLTPLQTENLRLRVAAEKKLPPELIDRLKGGTKEEMQADADELLKLVGTPDTTSFDGGARDTATPKDMDSLIRRSAGVRT
jgi:predicted nuclease with TOPRIM domain